MPDIKAYIYYNNPDRVPDRAFERAAHWDWSTDPVAPHFNVEFMGVTTKQDFLNAWNALLSEATVNRVGISSVTVYCHASWDPTTESGLEFADLASGTLTRTELAGLPKLPWVSTDSFIDLVGCNTGEPLFRGWSPADVISTTQGVTGFGQKGWAYFSRKDDTYVPAGPSDTEIYLAAYRRGLNAPLGDGKKIPAAVFNLQHTPLKFPDVGFKADQLAEYLEFKRSPERCLSGIFRENIASVGSTSHRKSSH